MSMKMPTIRRLSFPGVCKRWRLKRCAALQADYPLWRDFPYEYELDRLAIDVINGSTLLRDWVDDNNATPGDLENITRVDEQAWGSRAQQVFIVLVLIS